MTATTQSGNQKAHVAHLVVKKCSSAYIMDANECDKKIWFLIVKMSEYNRKIRVICVTVSGMQDWCVSDR